MFKGTTDKLDMLTSTLSVLLIGVRLKVIVIIIIIHYFLSVQ